MNPKFQTFLDKVREPVYVLVIIAAIFIVYGDRMYFEQLFASSAPTPSPAASQTAPAANGATSTQAATQAQPSAAIAVVDPGAFPTSIAAGQIVPFSFTITNTGDMAASFPYKVYVDWNTGEENVIDENVLTLAAGASQTLPEALKFETAGIKGEVIIKIQNTGASARFALPVK